MFQRLFRSHLTYEEFLQAVAQGRVEQVTTHIAQNKDAINKIKEFLKKDNCYWKLLNDLLTVYNRLGNALGIAAKGGFAENTDKIVNALINLEIPGLINFEAKETGLGCTPLINAITHNQAQTVRALVKAGVDPNLGRIFSYTPLAFAVNRGYAEVVAELQASPNIPVTAFNSAAAAGVAISPAGNIPASKASPGLFHRDNSGIKPNSDQPEPATIVDKHNLL